MTRSRRAASVGTILAIAALLVPAGTFAGPPTDLLPDLRMAKPSDIRVQESSTSRLLRFSALIVNVGDGPLVVRGKRDCSTSDCPDMRTAQRIRQSDGTWRGVPSTRKGKFNVGDGHNHWHVMKFQTYELFQLDAPPAGPAVALRGAKTGFCFFDTNARRMDLPNAPRTRQFFETDCGRSWSTKFRMGLSVGWGDLYPWSIARQWIDVTDVPDGRYLLCSTANAQGDWLERNTANNQAWAVVDLAGDSVSVRSRGRDACGAQLPAGITWAFRGAQTDTGSSGSASSATTMAYDAAATTYRASTTRWEATPAAVTVAGHLGSGFLCAIPGSDARAPADA